MRTVRRKIRWGRLSIVLMGLILGIGFVIWTGFQFYRMLSNPPVTANEKSSLSWNDTTHIVLVGLDAGEVDKEKVVRQADAVIVFSIEPVEKQVRFLFLPRNTKVPISGYNNGYGTLTDSYKIGGMDLLIKKIEGILHVPLHYHVSVDIDSFIRVIDWLGGVDHYVEKMMRHEDEASDLHIQLSKGYQHLDGKTASDYIRFRNDDFGELGRVQRQQRLVRSLLQEKLEYKTLLMLPYLDDNYKSYINTDMKSTDLLNLINSIRKFDVKNAEIVIFPGKLVNENGISFWLPDMEKKSIH